MGINDNLPPGVTVNMILGNRPEDQEVETTIIFSIGDLWDMKDYIDGIDTPIKKHNLKVVLSNIIEQVVEDYPDLFGEEGEENAEY